VVFGDCLHVNVLFFLLSGSYFDFLRVQGSLPGLLKFLILEISELLDRDFYLADFILLEFLYGSGSCTAGFKQAEFNSCELNKSVEKECDKLWHFERYSFGLLNIFLFCSVRCLCRPLRRKALYFALLNPIHTPAVKYGC
jgi:hypothetical protein